MAIYRSERGPRGIEALRVLRGWWVPLAFLALAVALFALRASGQATAPWLGVAAQTAVLAIFVSGFLAVGSEVSRATGREMVFELSDNALLRKRPGTEDVEIPFREVSTIRRTGYWLVLTAIAPPRRICVPRSIKGFDELVAQVAARSPSDAQVRRFRTSGSTVGLLNLIVSIAAWSVFSFASQQTVAMVSAVVGAATLAVVSRWILSTLGRGPGRWPARAVVAVGWFSAVAAIAFKGRVL